jgi:DNA polymerase III subunit delta
MIFESLEALENDLKKTVRSVYLLLGPEEYQSTQALNLLKKQIVPPEAVDFDYSIFAAEDVPVDEILGAANVFPMVSKRRLVVVRDAQNIKDVDAESLLESLPSISPRSTVIFTALELDHRKKFYKTLREQFCVAEFSKLKDAALNRWVEDYIKKHGYRLSPASLKKIVELAGSDLQSLASELDKLMLYAGDAKVIPDHAIEDLVRTSRQQGIFNLIDAVNQRDRNTALKSLANLLSMGDHPLVVVNMLTRNCRQMLIAKEGMQKGLSSRDIGAAAQIQPYFIDKFVRQVRDVDIHDIQTMYLRLAAMDKQMKSTSLDGKVLLESLICSLV